MVLESASCATMTNGCVPSCLKCTTLPRSTRSAHRTKRSTTQQLAAMGLDVSQLVQTLQAQNAIQPSGIVNADVEKIAIRVSGQFTSEESLKAVNFRFNGRFFR